MTQQPGKISISRPHGDCDYIIIQVTDGASRVPFVDVKIKYANFTKALTGQHGIDCEIVTRGLELIGKVREHKQEAVLIPERRLGDGRKTNKQAVRDAILAHEVDGWMGRDEDAQNHHKAIVGRKDSDGGTWYNVVFVRYVDPEVAQ